MVPKWSQSYHQIIIIIIIIIIITIIIITIIIIIMVIVILVAIIIILTSAEVRAPRPLRAVEGECRSWGPLVLALSWPSM